MTNRIFPLSKFKVHGNSMFPTLREGQEVLTFNWGKPKVGDVVVVKASGREIVKRLTKINDRQILVVGDNKKESTDSRHFGPIGMDQVIGKVV